MSQNVQVMSLFLCRGSCKFCPDFHVAEGASDVLIFMSWKVCTSDVLIFMSRKVQVMS